MTKRLILLPLLLLTMQVAWAEKVAQALVLNNYTMYFIFDEPVSVGSTYKGQTVSQVWSGNEVIVYPEWENKDIATSSTRVVFDPSFAAVRPTSCKYWFLNFFSLSVIEGLQYLNTSEVTSMYDMFANCSSLTTLDVTTFDTRQVTDMGGMFQGCSSLTTLNLGSFNIANVKIASSMFKGCSKLEAIYVPAESVETYKAAAGWMTYKDLIKPIGGTTAINGINVLPGTEGRWYTLDGRRLVGKPTQKGLYIINGKKVIVK